MTKKFKIKKHDQVLVTAGGDKGRVGTVLAVDIEGDRVTVSGVNVVKRHVRPSQANPDGGIVEKTKSIHISNVSLFVEKDGKNIPTRVGISRDENANRQRILKKTGEVVGEYDYSKKS